MVDHMFGCSKSVELDKVMDEQEKAVKKVFDSNQEVIILYKSYGTQELAGNAESILNDYLRDENTNSGSGNPCHEIVYQMFPDRKTRLLSSSLKTF
uniref:ADF-H domain-containing protein n=1 Tax=Rhabditophanes sp. KR3021 TaxID=114890 RepID=A0AC35TM13_9BILA